MYLRKVIHFEYISKTHQQQQPTHSSFPSQMSFQLQQTIRNNAQQLKQYMTDLYDWQQQMQYKQKANKKQKQSNQQTRAQQEEEFRQKKIQEEKQQAQKERKEALDKKKEMIRDANTVQDYYKAWDKFNPDEEIKRLEEQQKRAYRPYNPYEDSKNNLRAKAQTKMVVKGTRGPVVRDPTSLKDKGNVHFKVCQYERAINYYTECIDKVHNEEDPTTENNKKLLALVYSNRAMAYIKINQRAKALEDCNSSLQYDPQYAKTYLRRADCLKKLGKYKESLADFKMVKKLTPSQPEADIEIRKIEQFLKRRIKETQESMVVTPVPKSLPGGYRIEIAEVDDFDREDTGIQEAVRKQDVNPLEQL